MSPALLAGLDAGTSSVRAILFNLQGRVVASASLPARTRHPHPGWAEQDADDLRRQCRWVLGQALARPAAKRGHLLGVGIANQRESVVAVDARTSRPLSPVILWHDMRTEGFLKELGAGGWRARLWRSAGLPLTTYPSAPKMAWLLRHSQPVRAAAARGALKFVTVDSWIAHDLLGGGTWVTDPSNASRTLLFHLERARYDPPALTHFGVEEEMLPTVIPSFGRPVGTLEGVPGVPEGVPLMSLLGDQQASLLGLTWGTQAQAKLTIGTGAFLLSRTGARSDAPAHGLVKTVLWQRAGESRELGLEGAVGSAGSFLDWLCGKGMRLFRDVGELERLARRSRGGPEVFVPALGGLFAPYWRVEARGWLGRLSLATRREDLARAAVDGLAHRLSDILEATTAAGGEDLSPLLVDGGLSRSSYLLQRTADLSGIRLQIAHNPEGTAWGAALSAGLGLGLFRPQDWAPAATPRGKGALITPAVGSRERDQERERWRSACLNAVL